MIISVITFISLMAAMTVQYFYSRYTSTQTMLEEIAVLSKIAADRSTAAIMFSDQKAATENMLALGIHSNIDLACLYLANSDLLAFYIRTGTQIKTCPEMPEMTGSDVKNLYADFVEPVILDGKQISILLVRTNFKALNSKNSDFLIIAALTIMGAILLGFVAATRLQRLVSKPIQHLVNITSNITETKNYDLYAEKYSEDEVGKLVDSFNRMLETIRVRDKLLSESRERFRALTESTSDWIWEVDTKGVFTYSSPSIEQLLGYKPEEIIGRNIIDLMPADEAEKLAKIFSGIIQSALPFNNLENTSLTRDGKKVLLETNGVPFFDDSGKLLGYRGIDRNITERKQHEILLSLQTRRAEALLKLPLSAENLDEETFIQFGLELAEDLTESKISFLHSVNDANTIELITWSKRTLDHYCHANYDKHYPVKEAAGVWADALRHHKTVVINDYENYDHKHGLPDGHAELKRLISLPVYDEGKIALLVGVGNKVNDYTDFDVETLKLISNEIWRVIQRRSSERLLKEYQDHLEQQVKERTSQLAKASERAEAANKSKSLFLANMSHEIRTPLHGVIGISQLLSLQDFKPVQKEMVEKLSISAELLQHLIDDILDFSKIESGKIKLEYINYNLRKVIDECLQTFESQINEKGLELILQMNSSVPELLFGDSKKLSQILLNLVSNAIKFTNSGTITIKINCREQIETEILLLLSVIDTGIGIAQEEQQKIFSNFTQADNSISRRYGGSGLGLSICKQLVEMMFGHIRIESHLGEGSTFSCQIPMLKAEKTSLQKTQREISTDFHKMHILVVDDEKINLFMMENILKLEGIKVTLADNGKKALEIAEQEKFDLVLMDLHMPNLNGWETTRLFRASPLPQLSRVPIIGVTADVLKESHKLCIEVGMNSVISKPFQFTDLLQQIQFLKDTQ